MNEDRELLLKDDRSVAEALQFAGLRVTSVYDLVNTASPYPEAIPILCRMLHEVRHPRIKEGILRALSVKEATPLGPDLIRMFRETTANDRPSQSLKWVLGNTISVIADESMMSDVIELIENPEHGGARFMLPRALAKAKGQDRDRAVKVLLKAPCSYWMSTTSAGVSLDLVSCHA